jgi:hypothetical protein
MESSISLRKQKGQPPSRFLVKAMLALNSSEHFPAPRNGLCPFGLASHYSGSHLKDLGEACYEATNITWRSAVKQVLLQPTPQFI